MCQILLENEISIFKKLVSRSYHEVLQNFFVNGCSDVGFQKTQWTNTSRWHCTPNHHRLWKLNTGLHAAWAMSFSTLPPNSRTLVSKWNTKLALIWKEDFGPLGNSPVLLLLSPGKTPLTLSVVQEWLNKRNTTTVAKFLDTSVCGGSWCLDPSLSPFLVKFTQILFFLLSTIFFIFIFSQTTQHNIQNKTKQNSRHILNISKFNKKGRERGKDNKNTKVTPLHNHIYSVKNTAKPQWLKAWPHRLAPLYIHMRQFAGGYGSNMPLYTCVV